MTATGSHTLNGDEIVLDSGGQEVTLHLMVSGWDPAATGRLLGSFQGTVDPAGYLGVNADTPKPWIDLNPLGWPLTPTDGAFQGIDVCGNLDCLFDPTNPACDWDEFSNCAVTPCPDPPDPRPFCFERPDWVFAGGNYVEAVTTDSLSYSWSAASTSCAVDPDGVTRFYGGTLVVQVPVEAVGTYTISLVDNPNFTLATDCFAIPFGTVNRTPVRITILCLADGDCDDNDACTDDTCDPDGACQNVLNYDPVTFCCDPITGQLTAIDDSNECTDDACNPDGIAEHTPVPGRNCGGPPVDPCDAQNTCDVFGTCVEHHAPPDTACGDLNESECDQPDSCDGAGVCLPNYVPEGTSCGDTTETQCDSPDTCDGSGICQPNYVPPGTPCDDGLFCTIDEICSDGACGSGAFTCDDAVDCTDDSCDELAQRCDNVPNDASCDNGQFCDGVEICDAFLDCVVAPGSVPDCDDAVTCTDDSCDEINDTCVNQPNDANCNNGQFCDGVEICDALLDCLVEPGSVPICDDAVDCTEDSCDEAADTCVNSPNDAFCLDDGLFCNGPEVCTLEAGCISAGCPCGTDCATACDEQNDVCLCDPPIAVGVGGRYLFISPQPADSTAPQAITILPYCPDGVLRYVGPPEPFDVDLDGFPDGNVARVVDDPSQAAWLLPSEWGDPLYVTGVHVVPGTEFIIKGDCGTPGAPSFSDTATATTWRWGDTNDDSYVNVTDIQRVKFGLIRDYALQTIPNLDLWGVGLNPGDMCDPQQFINITDLLMDLWAFQGVSYSAMGCPVDCPACLPEVHCNDQNACTIDSCNIDGTCSNVLDFDESVWCCSPANHDLTLIDDGDPCTTDVCDEDTGFVTHTPLDCDDGADCTLDSCVDGACVNTPFDSIECSSNADCPATSSGCAGFCTCPGAPAAVVEWVPVAADVPHTIDGNHISLGLGGGQVTLHLLISNWDFLDTGEELRAFQGAIDPAGYLGVNADPPNPGVDLNPLGWPDTPELGGFQATGVCATLPCLFDPTDPGCAWDPFSHCPDYDCAEPYPLCADRPDWVFPVGSLNYVAVVATHEIGYRWAGIVQSDQPCTVDDGSRRYGGTLILEIPPAANGTYTIGFDEDPQFSLLIDCASALHTPTRFIPAVITAEAGR
ncbi:MAG: hypothetical protein ACE5HE_06040 [Phycisphaerae bacterium]